MTTDLALKDRARNFFAELQDKICTALERTDGKATFREDIWQREGGGGGRTRVIEEGALFEKAGVNFSEVHGQLDEAFASRLPIGEGTEFFACGISLVLHPLNPFVPTVHANFRYLERGSSGWFGGGTDLTPYYPYLQDAVHFHLTLKQACDRFDPSYYPRFKKACDDYFFIKHRNESRGVGGVFFDYLTDHRVDAPQPSSGQGLESIFKFVQEVGLAFLPAYLPIVERRKTEAYTQRERSFQMIRRGRYVEFNLVYDRGTLFGLQSGGRTESILMSLPPQVRWSYDWKAEPGSEEARLTEYFLQDRDWLAEA